MVSSLRTFLIILFLLHLSIIYKSHADVTINEENKSVGGDRLSNQEKEALLKIARETLESIVNYNVTPKINRNDFEKFNKKSGVFVTLKKKGELRGCIGNIFPKQIMFNAVTGNTINSALFDRRFVPVSKHELYDIEIEISVLSPIEKINSYEDFKVGMHGIIIRKGSASAVFLPQVAVEQNWSKDEALSRLCAKAGLPQNTWKDSDMVFSVFTADVFKESDFASIQTQ